MSHETLISALYVFALAAFLGYQVISRVPPLLHTPLMSATNAIHGVIIVGALIVLAKANGPIEIAIGVVAVVFAMLNVVGGFVVTDRMLEMFSAKKRPKE